MNEASQLVPWERIGIRLPHPGSAEDAVKFARLNYVVEKKPLKTVYQRSHIDVEGFYATVRMDSGRSLGVVKDRYTVVQNSDAFSFISPFANREFFIETGGVVDDGRKAWLLLRLKQEMRIGRNADGIRKYLLVVNSHDGSMNLTVKPSAIRIWCSNSIPAILRGSDPEIRLRHTPNVHDRIDDVRSLLRQTENTFVEMERIFNQMALKRITNKQLQEYVARLVPDNEMVESHAKTENLRKKILYLAENGIGAEAYRGTLFSLLNSTSEAVDHQVTTDPNKLLKSVWFGGSGEKLKERAFEIAASSL